MSYFRFALWIGFMAAAVGCGEITPLEVQQSHVNHTHLSSADIPASWVISGHPRARAKLLARTGDEEVYASLWDCTAGKFNWHFHSDELVHILDGDVTVTSNGESRLLKKGDVAYFPAGTDSVWDVQKYVKKFAVLRSNRESLMRRAHRKINELFAAL